MRSPITWTAILGTGVGALVVWGLSLPLATLSYEPALLVSLATLLVTGASLLLFGGQHRPLTAITIASAFAFINSMKLFAIVWFQGGDSRWVLGAKSESALVGAAYLTGWAALVIGYWLRRRSKLAVEVPETDLMRSVPFPPRTYLTAVFGIGLVAYYLLLQSAGGLQYVLANVQQRQVLFAGKHYLILVMRLTYMSGLAMLARNFVHPRSRRYALGVLMITGSFMVFASLGGRSQALVIIVMALALLAMHRPVSRTAMLYLGLASIGFLIIAGVYRASGGNLAQVKFSTDAFLGTFLDTDGFILMAALRKQGALAFQHGASYLALLANVVPRALWPSKPPTIDLLISQVFDPSTSSGKTVTVFGELYINFMLPGVILGSAVWGWMLGLLDSKASSKPSYWASLALAVAITRLTAPGPESTQPFVLFEDLFTLVVVAAPSMISYFLRGRSTRVAATSKVS